VQPSHRRARALARHACRTCRTCHQDRTRAAPLELITGAVARLELMWDETNELRGAAARSSPTASCGLTQSREEGGRLAIGWPGALRRSLWEHCVGRRLGRRSGASAQPRALKRSPVRALEKEREPRVWKLVKHQVRLGHGYHRRPHHTRILPASKASRGTFLEEGPHRRGRENDRVPPLAHRR